MINNDLSDYPRYTCNHCGFKLKPQPGFADQVLHFCDAWHERLYHNWQKYLQIQEAWKQVVAKTPWDSLPWRNMRANLRT